MSETNNTDLASYMLNDSTYNKVKRLVTIVLPASGALYFGLAQIWGFPAGEQVVGTIVVVQTFLGVVLGISSASYNSSDARYSGSLDIHETAQKDSYLLNLDEHPETLKTKDEVILKVKNK